MFHKSRKKIVAAIMSILTLLWLGTLAIIYISSYIEVSRTNIEMLQEHTALYDLNKPLDGFVPNAPMQNKGPHFDTNHYKLSTFYSVAISDSGEILEVKTGEKDVFTQSELEHIARTVLKKKSATGVTNHLIYYKADKGGYTLVAFMDNTIIWESMTTLFRYTLIFGCVAILALYFLAVYLARRIVQPLEESYQKQRQFISDAGHELKTPVSVVSANAELLSREIGENLWLSNIQYENERMGRLVAQLLELARTENLVPVTEHLDFSRIVAGGALPFDSIAFEKDLVLNVQIEEHISLLGNRTQLSQLVSILIDNAIRHGSSGKEVLVSLSHTRTAAVLSVINTGAPIPPEQTELIFERFYRSDEARNSEDRHYGLGLAIAKAIVDAHEGRIEVRCHDGLIEFRVMLPLGRST